MRSQRLWAVWMLGALALGGCSCDGGGLGSTTAGFRTATTEIDFGKALEGTSIARTVELTATGRSDVVVDVTTEGPFSAPSAVELPGGATRKLDVTFTAGTGEASGKLILSSHGESFEVALRGLGIHPLDCQPSVSCRESHFSLESESCEETVAADGTGCTPSDLCLENGVCRSGACVGTPRSCDDGNACTQDACSPDVGCVHLDASAQCPTPQNPCEVATCNPTSGCGSESRSDDSPCGSIDCVNAHLCRAGICLTLPTPEGFLCAPSTPCQGEGHCTGGRCARPDAGVMTASWSVALGDSPEEVTPETKRLFASGGNVFFQSCNLSSEDGGCALVSYTSNGFQRFEQPVGADAILHAIAGPLALVSEADRLEAFASSGGALAWSLPLAGEDGGIALLPRDGVAVTTRGEIALALSWTAPAEDAVDAGELDAGELADAGDDDAGLDEDAGEDAGAAGDAGVFAGVTLAFLDPDGGTVTREQLVPDAGFGSVIALGSNGELWLSAPGSSVLQGALDPDGGVVALNVAGIAPAGASSLSVGQGGALAFVGGELQFDANAAADGGIVGLLDPGETPLGTEVLSSGDTGFVFLRACRPPFPSPCADEERATILRAFSLSTGQRLWNTPVLPGLVSGSLVEATVLGPPVPQGVLTLTQANLPDTGLRADVQLFAAGQRAMLCPLEGAPRVAGALFDQGRLFVLVDRQGQWRLEAYDLGMIPAAQSGWTRFGASSPGTRRER